eukprot:GHVP01021350.1.p1 GENE.GHVP01021350.1~~GHVP01021350.1.p1  ORF type:complete len:547 (-),score=85.11 GHVP01021350.1:964-2604(-)
MSIYDDSTIFQIKKSIYKAQQNNSKIVYCCNSETKIQTISNICTSMLDSKILVFDENTPLYWAYPCTGNCKELQSLENDIYTTSEIVQLSKESGICTRFALRDILENSTFFLCRPFFLILSEFHLFVKFLNTGIDLIYDNPTFFEFYTRPNLSITDNELVYSLNHIKSLQEKCRILEDSSYNEIKNGSIGYKKENKEIFPGSMRKSKHFLSILKRLFETLRVLKRSHNEANNTLNLIIEKAQISKSELEECLRRYSLHFEAKIINKKLGCKKLIRMNERENSCKKILSIIYLLVRYTNIKLYHEGDPDKLKMLLFSSHEIKSYLEGIFENIDFINNKAENPVLIVTRGNDQVSMGSENSILSDSVLGNYGRILIDVSKIIPEGIVCYFPNMKIIESCLLFWKKTGLLDGILNKKLLFIQDKNLSESLLCHKEVCNRGHGSIILCTPSCGIENCLIEKKHKRATLIFGLLDSKDSQYITEDVDLNLNKCTLSIGHYLYKNSGFVILIGREYKKLVMESESWFLDNLLEDSSDLSIEAAVNKLLVHFE